MLVQSLLTLSKVFPGIPFFRFPYGHYGSKGIRLSSTTKESIPYQWSMCSMLLSQGAETAWQSDKLDGQSQAQVGLSSILMGLRMLLQGLPEEEG